MTEHSQQGSDEQVRPLVPVLRQLCVYTGVRLILGDKIAYRKFFLLPPLRPWPEQGNQNRVMQASFT